MRAARQPHVPRLRGVIPPANDDQQAADFLLDSVGTSNPFVQWAVVRPDTLLEGDASEYALHGGTVSSLFAPDKTSMANLAHFICELVTDPKAWDDWKGRLPTPRLHESPRSQHARLPRGSAWYLLY